MVPSAPPVTGETPAVVKPNTSPPAIEQSGAAPFAWTRAPSTAVYRCPGAGISLARLSPQGYTLLAAAGGDSCVMLPDGRDDFVIVFYRRSRASAEIAAGSYLAQASKRSLAGLSLLEGRP